MPAANRRYLKAFAHCTKVLVLAIGVAPGTPATHFRYMKGQGLGRSLALGVWALGAFTTLANLSMPVAAWRPGRPVTVVVALLIVGHGALYWDAERVRGRFTLAGYLAAQATIVFLIGLTNAPVPAVLALYAALTVETIIVAGQRWGTMPITVGAIALYGAGAIIMSDLYRGATAGVLLAVTGVMAHLIEALVKRRRHEPGLPIGPESGGTPILATQPGPVDFDRRELARLTGREREVLQALTNGGRTSEIAARLGITERTVKAHLASIYQKLGVESRTAAVAMVLQNRQG